MKKRLSSTALSLLIFIGMLALPVSVFGAMGRLRIRLTGPSEIQRARLYVNGRYKGFIYKNRTQSVMVERGRSHVVRIYRRQGGDLYQRTKVISFNSTSSNYSLSLALKKKNTSSKGRLRLRLSSRTPFTSARLYVNGSYKGMVYTSRTRSFTVPSGRIRVAVRRQWRRNHYEYRKRITIRRGGSVYRLAYMTRQDSDGPAEDEESGRARLRVKIRNSSPMPNARLYVNGRYIGRVYRSGYRTYTIPSGRVRIYAKRTWRGIPYRSRTQRRNTRSGRRISLLLRMEER